MMQGQSYKNHGIVKLLENDLPKTNFTSDKKNTAMSYKCTSVLLKNNNKNYVCFIGLSPMSGNKITQFFCPQCQTNQIKSKRNFLVNK
jgi:hypothetical protein